MEIVRVLSATVLALFLLAQILTNSFQSHEILNFRTAYAQAPLSLSGYVEDDSGLKVSNAKVSLLDEQGKEIKTSLSDFFGFYIFTDLARDNYFLKTQRAGFEEKEIKIDLTDSENLDIKLKKSLKPSLAFVRLAVHVQDIHTGCALSSAEITVTSLEGLQPPTKMRTQNDGNNNMILAVKSAYLEEKDVFLNLPSDYSIEVIRD
ncbi:MAG: carboxypeptidase-like regulatory domain-containing protein [Nitrosopumilaceae archaeon]